MSDAHHDLGRDVGVAVVKILPPVAVWSFGLNDVLVMVSIVYVVLQIIHLLLKWRNAG
jgi:hypothetical protein